MFFYYDCVTLVQSGSPLSFKRERGRMCLEHNKKWNHTINPKTNGGLVPVTYFQPSFALTSPMYLYRSLFQMCHLYYLEERAGAPPQVSTTKDLLEQQ